MVHRKNSYSEAFKIRASEVDPTGKMRLPALANLLQEVAGSNALELDFDISHLNTQNLTWVLHRLHVQMDWLPEWRDEISIKTWPSGGNGLRAYRDFLILDTSENEIGRSLSYWLMLDLKSKRPVRVPETILATALNNGEHVLPVNSARLAFEENTPMQDTFTVRQRDLDMNHHANNVTYIEWVLETLPQNTSIHEMDIEFRTECTYGEEVEGGFIKGDSGLNQHRLRRKQDRRIVALATSK